MNRFDLQSYALLALNRLRALGRPSRVPLFAPPCVLHTGGAAVSHLYKDIFVERSYAIPAGRPAPLRILDAGAHIGLASMFFLQAYPTAEVLSVEANPTTLEVLRKNLGPRKRRVQIVGKALADHDGTTEFFVTSGTRTNVNAGMLNRERSGAHVTRLQVPCVDVKSLLDAPFDFAKIDIEGAEYDVLMTEAFVPERVRAMVVEFHDIDQRRDQLAHVLRTMTEARGYLLTDARGRPISSSDLGRDPGEHSVVCRLESPT